MLFSSSSDQRCLCHLGKRSWIDDPELGQFFKERITSKRQKATFDDCHSRNTWLWKVCWFRDTGVVLTGCRLFGLSIGKLASAFARYYNKKSLLFLALFLIIEFSTGWIPFLIGTTSLISQPKRCPVSTRRSWHLRFPVPSSWLDQNSLWRGKFRGFAWL